MWQALDKSFIGKGDHLVGLVLNLVL
jgi:hypothetical protein